MSTWGNRKVFMNPSPLGSFFSSSGGFVACSLLRAIHGSFPSPAHGPLVRCGFKLNDIWLVPRISSWPQVTQIVYRRKRLARWAGKCSVLGYDSPGRCPRCTTQVKDPSGLVPLVSKVGWLRQASAKTTDPHVLVTWVKKIGGHAQAGESHSPSGRAGRGLDAHSVSVVAFQRRSPAGQAGRGLTRLV